MHFYFIPNFGVIQVEITLLTLWCLKNVFKEMHASPMWLNILNTFVAVPPASKIANDNKILAAGKRVLSMYGWLLQVVSLSLHFGLAQRIRTSAIVPIFFVSSNGLSSLHTGQNCSNRSSCDRKTINFGSFRVSVSTGYMLKSWKEIKVSSIVYAFFH